ncbi:hypothetical protein ACHAXA_005834 [Cyclostephanos tholiformis]|uniref:Succinate dehydrogenase assembly factor 3 n=1 Tax=Cyclostephanos tholiformis TaxID=382380 RepID=A0ABD3S026_9STRA
MTFLQGGKKKMQTRTRALSLYKSILRAHDRYLPSQSMKQLGDAYVKSEFRLHKNAKSEQASMFLVEWEKYLEHIERTGRENQSIDVGMADHQRRQEHQLHSSQMQIAEQEHQQQQRRQRGGSLFFGRDVSNDVVFNEDQVGQLDKLREEASKAAGNGG